mgnify:CR=1 FL=1
MTLPASLRSWRNTILLTAAAIAACQLSAPTLHGTVGLGPATPRPRGLAVGPDASRVWLADSTSVVHELDPSNGNITSSSSATPWTNVAALAADDENDGVWALYEDEQLVLWAPWAAPGPVGSMHAVTSHPFVLDSPPSSTVTTIIPTDVDHLGEDRFVITYLGFDTAPPGDWFGFVEFVDVGTGDSNTFLLPLTMTPGTAAPLVSHDDYTDDVMVVMPNATTASGGHWYASFAGAGALPVGAVEPPDQGLFLFEGSPGHVVDMTTFGNNVTLLVDEGTQHAAWNTTETDLQSGIVSSSVRQVLPGTAMALSGPENHDVGIGGVAVFFDTVLAGATELGSMMLTK